MFKKVGYPVFYLYLYKLIKKKANGRPIIAHCALLEVFRRNLLWVPRCLHYPMIEELESLKLIKKINRRKYDLIGGDKDKLLNKLNLPI